MSERDLPYGRQWIDDDDVAAVVAALRGDWLTQGPRITEFEERLAVATGAAHVVAVASGTAALHLACLAAGMRRGDTGITSTVTFVASANAMRYAGATPYFADIDPATGLVSVDSLAARAQSLHDAGKTPKVFIPVDLTGTPADLVAVRKVADGHGALVIEDAAHSLGAQYQRGDEWVGAGCGLDAHMAILSFHPVKHVTTGEGGAITTNDAALAQELRDLRTHGITKDPARLRQNDGPWYYEQQALGYHYRITDLQCALGISQMRKLEMFVTRRRALARRYDEALRRLASSLQPLHVRPGARPSHHLYVVRVVRRDGESLADVARRRLNLFEHLRRAHIHPQVHYIPVHRQPDFTENGLGEGSFPGADAYYASCISLPMFPAMTDGDVDRVVAALASWTG